MQKKLAVTLLLFISASTFMLGQEWERIAEGLQFPEGPAWNGSELYVSSCYGGYITRIHDGGSSVFIDSTMKPFRLKQTNGLAIGAGGNIYACDYGIGAILKITPSGETEILSAGFNGQKFNRPNDLAFSPGGYLYFTDPKSYGKDKPDGRIFRLDVNSGETVLVEEGLCFPNGIAFSADGSRLYVCESAQNRILRYNLTEEGGLSGKEVFIELPGGDPDGLAFDTGGNLYCAHFGSGRIFVISNNGEIIEEINAPGKKPSNLEFGGTDMKTLYLTEDETNSVYKIASKVPGFVLYGLKN